MIKIISAVSIIIFGYDLINSLRLFRILVIFYIYNCIECQRVELI